MSVSLCTVHDGGDISDAARSLSALFDDVIAVPEMPTRAEAREAAQSSVRSRWSFWLEPEDVLTDASRLALEQLIQRLDDAPHAAYRMRCAALTTARRIADGEWQVRLVRREAGSPADSDVVVLRRAPAQRFGDHSQSLADLRAVQRRLTETPRDTSLLVQAAAHLIDLGQPDEALETMKPCDARTTAWLRAHAHLRAARPGAALNALHLVDRDQHDAVTLALLEAQVRAQLGDVDRAVAVLELAVAGLALHELSTIDEVQAITLLGECHLVRERYDRAERTARGLVVARPDYGPAWLLLADALIAQRNADGLVDVEQRLTELPGAKDAAALVRAARLACLCRERAAPAQLPSAFARRLEHARVPALSCFFPWRSTDGVVLARQDPPKVSLTMIVRDEEANLGDCLEGAVDLVDEVVVVDTGSKDRTRTVAEHFGARVVDFAWCDDFAAARNCALDHARGEWVFILDADDRVLARDRERLRTLFASLPAQGEVAYCLRRVSLAEDGQIGRELEQALIFRRHADIRWEYRVHEQITPSLMQCGTTFEAPGICIIHTGYRDAQTNHAKAERNFHIVQKDLAERPSDPFVKFAFGMMLVDLQRYDEALDALLACKPTVVPGTEMACSLAIALARTYTALGRHADALDVVHRERIAARGHSGVALVEAELCVQAGDLDGAAEALADLPYDQNGRHDAPHARALMLLAELLLHRREHDKVATIGRTLVDSRPAFGGGWFVSIDALLARADRDGLGRLAERFASVRGADAARAVLEAARFVLDGNKDGAHAVIERARDCGRIIGILAVVEERIRAGGVRVPFASCSAPPWIRTPAVSKL